MKTLKITAAVCAIAAAFSINGMADDAFIQAGAPTVHPTDNISSVSFDNLIPTSQPTIVVQPPTVQPSDNLTHPTDQPLAPNNPPK